MIKIFVAEDQLLIQKDLCAKLKKASDDIEIVGTALNGQDAYQKITALSPDILFTDIRMPIASGLDLIQKLKENDIPVYTVILSGYKDFEYARQSMKLGVDDYLLKPVSVEDLHYTLDTLSEKIQTSKKENRHTLLNSLLHNYKTSVSTQELQALEPAFYYGILINAGSCSSLTLHDIYPSEEALTQLSVADLQHKYLGNHDTIYLLDGVTRNEKFLLISLQQNNTTKIKNLLLGLMDILRPSGYPVTLCLSTKTCDLSDIRSKHTLMRTQTANHLIFGHSSILYQKDFLENGTEFRHILDDSMEKKFKLDIQNKNLPSFLNHLKSFLLQCSKERVTQKQLDECLKKILYYIFDYADHKLFHNYALEIEEYLSTSKGYTDLTDSLLFLFEQACRNTLLNIEINSDSSHFIDKIKGYIHSHYSQEINIHNIATKFSITPAYLSRIFKKQEGIPPIEYLTKYRIEQACHYFLSSTMSIREVAELCGYSNQFYFSKAFKQIMGISPSEYRIKYQDVN